MINKSLSFNKYRTNSKLKYVKSTILLEKYVNAYNGLDKKKRHKQYIDVLYRNSKYCKQVSPKDVKILITPMKQNAYLNRICSIQPNSRGDKIKRKSMKRQFYQQKYNEQINQLSANLFIRQASKQPKSDIAKINQRSLYGSFSINPNSDLNKEYSIAFNQYSINKGQQIKCDSTNRGKKISKNILFMDQRCKLFKQKYFKKNDKKLNFRHKIKPLTEGEQLNQKNKISSNKKFSDKFIKNSQLQTTKNIRMSEDLSRPILPWEQQATQKGIYQDHF